MANAARLKETKEIYARAMETITESGDNFFDFLNTSKNLHKSFPFYAQVLIAAQRPGAKGLTSYAGWQKIGYVVKRGTKGIAILTGDPPSEAKDLVYMKWCRRGIYQLYSGFT